MILKYQTLDGAWRTVDGVTDVINHGYVANDQLYRMVEAYDGHGTIVHNTRLPVKPTDDSPSTNTPEDEYAGDSTRFYLVLTVHGERQHWAVCDLAQGFLLSDDGKTVDRLLK